MNVYLIEWIDYDYSPPAGVYSTKEKAEEALKHLNKDYIQSHYHITEFELDALPNL